MSNNHNTTALAIITAIIGIVMMAITYFIVIKQDGTVFATATTTIGTIVGYLLGKQRTTQQEKEAG
jgi:ABC-type cobalt transport system substrate-binding protein